ncbi:MAG: PAS domain S-box protein [Halapricum sp.]
MGTSGSIQVLYVDDDPHFGGLAGTFLEREEDDLQVHPATSIDEAQSLLAESDVDCVVSTYEISGQNGIEFLETLREDYPDLPFVLFTDQGSEGVASEAISTGVTDYVRKGNGSDQYTVLANRIVNAVDRNRTTRQLRASEERYRSLFTEMNEGVALQELVTDDTGEPIDYRILEVNRRYESILGLDRDDVVGERASDIYDANGAPYLDRYAEVVQTGESIEFETYYPPLEKHFRIAAFSPTDGQFATVFSDITEQKRAEARLRESQITYESLFNGINDAVFVHDPNGEFLAVNEAACERLGYSEEVLLGMSPFEVTAATADEINERFERIRRDGELTFETVLTTKADERIPVEMTSSRIEYFGMPAIMSVARDISERKERERQLETLNERFELALEAGQFGVWDWNVKTDEVTFSERWAEMLGYSLGEIKPHLSAWEKRVHPDDLPDARDALEAHFEGETDYYECDYRMQTKSGDWIWIRDIGKVFEWDEDGDPARMVGIHLDVTDRKERQRELRRQNERLEEFASVVSHDLRNPLQVASGRLELAREDCNSEHLDRIDDAIDRSQALIDDLLTLAQEGERVTETEVVELPPAVEDCWHHVETAEATLAVETDRSIRADDGRLQQLFENLFRNSVEHGNTDVTVTIGDLPERDGFYVADDGPGIPPDEREDIFESGYSTAEEGTGFGLSIVEEIVHAHNWEIIVTDSDTGGARFEISGVEIVE